MAPIKNVKNILMELRKVCQHPYLSAPDFENLDASEEEQQRQLIAASGKLMFLKLLLPKLKERGHRVLLFSQFKIALDRIEDFLYGEGINFLRLDGDVQQAQRQKSMDLFNAPNSEYDIFLLTTRAGGVGINLATADTVIIYDPDFNPHQDLQAIARSHRYGQTKKVLVFKLMVKGSVEENMINKGKRKMVLDHLVVQQMNKENEEGDVDNLLLQGAEAVYSNQGGINVPDIVYNSKNVDELIDKVEADADAEAQAMAERERAIVNGEVEPTRTAQQFGFAKIWEAEQNELRELEEEVEDEVGRADVDWQAILQNIERDKQERLAKEMEDRKARRRKAAAGRYIDGRLSDSGLSDRSTKGKGKNKVKGKDKRKSTQTTSSDADFAVNPDEVESSDDDDTSLPENLGDLTDEHGNIIRSHLVDPLKKNKKLQQRLAKERTLRDAAANGHVNGHVVGTPEAGPSAAIDTPASSDSLLSRGQLVGVVNSKGKRGREGETPEERAQRKAAKREARAAALAASSSTMGVAPSYSYPQTNGIAEPAVPLTAAPLTSSNVNHAEAQHIMQWLWQAITAVEGSSSSSARSWATMALPEIPMHERWATYNRLAAEVDKNLKTLGQEIYFTLDEQKMSVLKLFQEGGAVISDHSEMPPWPPRLGRMREGHTFSAHHAPPPAAGAAAPVQPQQHTYQPYQSPHLRHTVPAPRSSEPPTRMQQSPAPRHVNGSSIGIARPAQRATPASSSTPTPVVREGCEHCSGSHQLRDCNKLPPIERVEDLYRALSQSREPTEQKIKGLKAVAAAARLHLNAGRGLPTDLLELVNNVDTFVTAMGKPAPSAPGDGSQAQLQRSNSNITTPANSGGPPRDHPDHALPGRRQSGTRDEAIVIGDDDENGHTGHSTSKAAPGAGPAGPGSHSKKKRSKHVNVGCVICHSSQSHNANQCPIVQAGPENIRYALREMDPQHALYPVLQQILQQQLSQITRTTTHYDQNGYHPIVTACAFCETPCGRDLRTCAQLNGGRTALKGMIRQLTQRVEGGDGSARTRDRQNALYEVYKQWPREG